MVVDHNKGRFQKKNPYVDRRESKNREIRQALTHKARLRKKYIKELEKSGESIPDKESRQQQRERINDNEVKRPSFQERQQIAKERKKQLREEREKQNMERQEMVEKKRKDRERKKDQLSQTTRTGQPLMGPRISNLLEKIEKEYGDKV